MRKLAVGALLVAAAIARAGTIRPLTDVTTGATSLGDLDDAGAYVYAVSASDPLGTNPRHRPQIFRWAAATGAVEQITFYAEGVEPEKPSPMVYPAFPCLTPSVSDDGAWVAFVSRGDLAGGNADRSEELFLLATDGSALRQLTSTTETGASIPCFRLAGGGARVAFVGNADLTGANPDRRYQPFVVDANGSNLRQVAGTTSGTSWVDISDDGARVVFDDALQIFAVLADGTGLRQLAAGGADVRPEISGNGSMVAFSTSSWYAAPSTGCTGAIQVATVPWSGGTPTNVSGACTCWGGEPQPATAWMPTPTDDGASVRYTSDDWRANCSMDVFRAPSNWPWNPQVLTTKFLLPYPAPPCPWSRASGSGSRIAVICLGAPFGGVNPDGGPELHVVYADGTAQRPLSSGRTGGARGVAITGDGAWVAFTSRVGPAGEPEAPLGQVYRVAADATQLAAVTSIADGEPDFVAITDGGGTLVYRLGGSLHTIAADGTGLRALADGVGAADLAAAGNLVAYERDGNVRAVALDGTGDRLVASGANLAGIADDGSWIAYLRGYSVHRRPADLSGPEQTLRTLPLDAWLGDADISGNGSLVAYVADDDPFGTNPERNPEIFLWEQATASSRQLTFTARSSFEEIQFARDGSAVFTVTEAPYFSAAGRDLVRIAVTGGAVERVEGLRPCQVGFFASDSYSAIWEAPWEVPFFAPDADGSRVAFVGGRACAGGNPDGNPEVFLADRAAAGALRVTADGLAWDVETGAATYDVVRGDVASLAVAGDGSVDLGPVTCLEEDSPDNAAADAALPPSGHVFFYLTRGSAGPASGPGSYGTGTGGRERFPSSGGCAPSGSR